MTASQHTALRSAGADGRLTWADRRVVPGLVRRGWVRGEPGRKGRTLWFITPAGRSALRDGQVRPPPARPHWRSHWDRERLGDGRYRVEGHNLVRPARGMLWRVFCPDHPDEPVGYRDTLAEAVELLASHLTANVCRPRQCAVPHGKGPESR